MNFQIQCEACGIKGWVTGTYNFSALLGPNADPAVVFQEDDLAEVCEHISEGADFAIIDEEGGFYEG